jgi:hypothetical protein
MGRDQPASLPQKQEALFQMWRQYDKYGANWKEAQKRELLSPPRLFTTKRLPGLIDRLK